MTLENKYRRHWQSLGLTNTEKLKDFIAELFTKHDHQKDVLIELYKLAVSGMGPDFENQRPSRDRQRNVVVRMSIVPEI